MSPPLVEPKCAMGTRRLIACVAMGEALRDEHLSPESKGLHLLRELDDKGVRAIGVAYSRTTRDRAPVVLNVCPWCGASLFGAELAARTEAAGS